tara:strand:+ start:27705 stop:29411 length:1707 start_codon:yes stop_codon:yes gene_type:complete
MAFFSNNPWVGYLERSYQQVKASLLSRLTISNPEITDHSEGNILIIIIGMFAGVVEQLNYYIDNMAREAFIDTARFFSSMVRLVRMLDYRIKAKFAASVTLTIYLEDGSGNAQPATGTHWFPVGTMVRTSDGTEFRFTEAILIQIGDTQRSVGASQYILVPSTVLGNTTGAANEIFIIGSDYVHQSISIVINADIWEEQSTLGLSGPLDKHFIVDINASSEAYIQFGDGTFGMIPASPHPVQATWRDSQGAAGNLVSTSTITEWGTPPTVPGVTIALITNDLNPTGGSNYEGIESMRFRVPLSVRTLDRAVTPQDYVDITLLAPGVAKAGIHFCCDEGSCIHLYIAPMGGGIAQIPLINQTETYIQCRKMVMDLVCVSAAGITPVPLLLNVNAKNGVDIVDLETTIQAKLDTDFGFENSDLNRGVYLSDIYQAVDSVQGVENLDIPWITTRPYARPYDHINQLIWTRITTPNNTTIHNWQIQYQGGALFAIWRDTVWQGYATIGIPYTDLNNYIEFTISLALYSPGNTWKLRTYPYSGNQLIDDNTVPILEPTIIVTPSSANDCLQTC